MSFVIVWQFKKKDFIKIGYNFFNCGHENVWRKIVNAVWKEIMTNIMSFKSGRRYQISGIPQNSNSFFTKLDEIMVAFLLFCHIFVYKKIQIYSVLENQTKDILKRMRCCNQ